MLFLVLGAQLKFFLAKTWPENAVGMFSTQVGALFRSTLDRCCKVSDVTGWPISSRRFFTTCDDDSSAQ